MPIVQYGWQKDKIPGHDNHTKKKEDMLCTEDKENLGKLVSMFAKAAGAATRSLRLPTQTQTLVCPLANLYGDQRQRITSSLSPKNDSQASAKPEQPKYDDPNHPLYLHHSDQPGVVLVTQLLNDENYLTWSRSMLMALNTRNKEGFVDGTVKKPLHGSSTTL
ncbi:hypothetical protein L3X38_039441 [Prunus dulcis]|uniref:Retrotransposon Copia-like N-terminal domain-containing protein n=1 Tax=Prunus dulcis TaxID=3755 RepID=A0AAD4YT48_PRUDU|nr:hypothetical protein L3X38_039441 [Prunus dulcis]